MDNATANLARAATMVTGGTTETTAHVRLPQQSPMPSRWYGLHVCLIDVSMFLIDLSMFLVDLNIVLQLLAVGVIPRAL